MNLALECLDWETPISRAESLTLEAICRHGGIEVIADTSTATTRGGKWKFIFDRAPAYRSVQETYRPDLWGRIDGKVCGRTVIIVNSSFARELAENDQVFAMLLGGIRHYVIPSDAEIFEILSESPPFIERLA